MYSAAIQRRYINFLKYRLPTRPHTTVMYSLDHTSLYITIQLYSYTALYIKNDVSPPLWTVRVDVKLRQKATLTFHVVEAPLPVPEA